MSIRETLFGTKKQEEAQPVRKPSVDVRKQAPNAAARNPQAAPVALAEARQKVIAKIEDVPVHKSIASAKGGKFEISEAMQPFIAVLEIQERQYGILVTREYWRNNLHLGIKKKILSAGAVIVFEMVIESGPIRILYSNNAEKDLKQEFSSDNPELVARVERMVGAGLERRATDIHMCVRFDSPAKTGAILFRIDGALRVWDKFPADDLTLIAGYMYSKMAEESSRSDPSFQRDAMQACSIKANIAGRDVRIRYQSVRVNGGFDVVLRLLVLSKSDKFVSLSELGYEASQQASLDLASRKTMGAIIIAGVTGSGKSTTLKTLMTMNPRRHLVKSYSIEDPVEYKIFGVSQINVQRSSADQSDNNPYLQSMRVLMRADPDVIMAGEVRDEHSVSMMQTMVQSGHQVMTTVHTSSAIEILDRLSSETMGLSRYTMSSKNFISALVYQRLIPKLCVHCKLPAVQVVTEDRLQILKSKFDIGHEHMFAASEVDNDCPHCNGTGIHGLTVASEIILPTPEFLRLIRENKDSEAEELWRKTRKTAFDDPDMTGKTAFEHGLYKVSQGMVDPRHLEENFDPFESYHVLELDKK